LFTLSAIMVAHMNVALRGDAMTMPGLPDP
jgi:hypothetical protein